MKRFGVSILYFFKFLLLFLFIGYYGSITVFYHPHLVNGDVYVHSHPFKGSSDGQHPFPAHSHSSKEFGLIQQLNEIEWNSPLQTLALPPVPWIMHEIETGYFVLTSEEEPIAHPRLRAPPIFRSYF